jgi:hypothetical protein
MVKSAVQSCSVLMLMLGTSLTFLDFYLLLRAPPCMIPELEDRIQASSDQLLVAGDNRTAFLRCSRVFGSLGAAGSRVAMRCFWGMLHCFSDLLRMRTSRASCCLKDC